MTYAQAKRTRLTIWKNILDGIGGTSRPGDTLYQTVRKVATTLGISYSGRPTFRMLAKSIITTRPGIYSADNRVNSHVLPLGGWRRWGWEPDPAFGGGVVTPNVIGGEGGGDIIGGEGGEQIEAET